MVTMRSMYSKISIIISSSVSGAGYKKKKKDAQSVAAYWTFMNETLKRHIFAPYSQDDNMDE
jgi:hypothetical protein